MDKEVKNKPTEASEEEITSASIKNANAAGDGALERSEENDLSLPQKKEESKSPETPY